MLHRFAEICAHGINPLLLGLFVLIPLTPLNVSRVFRGWKRITAYYIVSAAAMGLVCWLAEMGKRMEVWPGKPWFPSGHQTLATAFAVCIWFLIAPKLRPLLVVPVLLMSFGVVYLKWHEPVDAAGGILLSITVVGGTLGLLSNLVNRKQVAVETVKGQL